MNRETVRETWTKRVERWRQSGLSYAVFSRENGLSDRSLRWWRIRLDKEGQEATTATVTAAPNTVSPKAAATEPKSARMRRARRKAAPLTFIELSAKPTEAAIELVVGACVVRVTSGFDPVTLGRVIDVLKERA